MKFILGLVLGIAGAWFYRARGQQDLTNAPENIRQAQESITTVVTAEAQRATEVIDKAPIPPQVNDAASGVARTGQKTSTGQRRSGARLSTKADGHGVESAAGRDRTQDGDVAPDLGTP